MHFPKFQVTGTLSTRDRIGMYNFGNSLQTSIYPTIWPQYTNVTDRTDRQRSDSIGRTVLQTVAQKKTASESLQKGAKSFP